MNSPEGVVLDCSIEEAIDYYQQRRSNDVRVSAYNLPLLKDNPAEIYKALVDSELELTNNGDYALGSAKKPDEILAMRGLSGVLLTAEHATDHHRKRDDGSVFIKSADRGTGALGKLISKDTDSTALISIGRQTSDANSESHHPLKERMSEIITIPFSKAHLSIHGMRAGLGPIRATRGYSVQLGIGKNPSEATRTLVEDYLKKIAEDYDLVIGVNQPHVRFKEGYPRLFDDNRMIETKTFAGDGNTTRSYAQSAAKELGKDNDFAAVQIELSDALRFLSLASDIFPTLQDRIFGGYLGYLFLREATISASKL